MDGMKGMGIGLAAAAVLGLSCSCIKVKPPRKAPEVVSAEVPEEAVSAGSAPGLAPAAAVGVVEKLGDNPASEWVKISCSSTGRSFHVNEKTSAQLIPAPEVSKETIETLSWRPAAQPKR